MHVVSSAYLPAAQRRSSSLHSTRLRAAHAHAHHHLPRHLLCTAALPNLILVETTMAYLRAVYARRRAGCLLQHYMTWMNGGYRHGGDVAGTPLRLPLWAPWRTPAAHATASDGWLLHTDVTRRAHYRAYYD